MRILLISILALFGLLVPVTASAEDIINNAGVCSANPEATLCKDNNSENINNNSIFGPNGIFTKVAQFITVVVGVAAVVMVISSGIQYAISSGDPARLNRAKDTLVYALIGLTIAVLAQAIIVFVLKEI